MHRERALIPAINPVSPDFEFKVGEDVFALHYGFSEIAAFEAGTGINPTFEGIGVSIVNYAVLLWVGLRKHHPAVSLEQVQEWFTPSTATALCEIVLAAFRGSLPPARPEKEGDSPDPLSA